MNTDSREHISCLMDGEISRETGRFLVRRLGADKELCATWARYHLVRDCLRHQDGRLASEDLTGRIRNALENESVRPTPHRVVQRWLRPVAGLAIAASVALMAIVAVGPDSPVVRTSGTSLAGRSEAPSFVSPQSLTPAPISQQASLSGGPAGDSRMNAYLLRHYQATGSTGGKGFVSFVPIVVTRAVEPPDASEPAGEELNNSNGKDSAQQR
jgi:sigma-E factor negative regulatory protein RseA